MGAFLSLLNENYPPKSKFSIDNIPDLKGQVMLVTGANTGIGKETAKALLSRNAKVYVASRDASKAAKAIEELKSTTGKEDIHFLELDLSDLKSVKRAAEEFTRREPVLHVLFNNAGITVKVITQQSVQGYSQPFATNVLGHFYFTKLLLPHLLAGANSEGEKGKQKARIINISSVMSHFCQSINYERLGGTAVSDEDNKHASSESSIQKNTEKPKKKKSSKKRKKVLPVDLYSESKFANAVLSNELARRYGDQGIVSISLNPGNLASDIMREYSKFDRAITAIVFNLYHVKYGALTPLYAGTMLEALEMNGKYLIPWARQGKINPLAQDPKIGEELWNWLEAQTRDL